jgi:hypothetical protein
MKKRAIPLSDWHYLINKKRFKVAWHGLLMWKRGGWRIRSWFFSVRNRSGYSNIINRFCHWYQVCILGLNIGFMYKIDND